MPPIRRSYKRLRKFIAANGEICTLLTIGCLFFISVIPLLPPCSLFFDHRRASPIGTTFRDLVLDAHNHALSIDVSWKRVTTYRSEIKPYSILNAREEHDIKKKINGKMHNKIQDYKNLIFSCALFFTVASKSLQSRDIICYILLFFTCNFFFFPNWRSFEKLTKD